MILSKKETLTGFAIQSAILLFLMSTITYTFGFLRGGFESQEVLTKFMFYGFPGLAGFIIIMLLFFVEYMQNEGDEKYGNSLGYYSPGDKPGLPFKWLSNWKVVLLMSILLFLIAGFFGVSEQRAFTGVGSIEQQFTKVDNLLFSMFLVAPAENFQIGAVIAMVVFFIRIIARKNDWSKANFAIISISTAFVAAGTIGLANHLIRYPGQDTSLIIVFSFWAVGGLLSLLTGVFYPFVIMHMANNGFYDSKGAFSSDVVTFWTIALILAVAALLSYVIYNERQKGKVSFT